MVQANPTQHLKEWSMFSKSGTCAENEDAEDERGEWKFEERVLGPRKGEGRRADESDPNPKQGWRIIKFRFRFQSLKVMTETKK